MPTFKNRYFWETAVRFQRNLCFPALMTPFAPSFCSADGPWHKWDFASTGRVPVTTELTSSYSLKLKFTRFWRWDNFCGTIWVVHHPHHYVMIRPKYFFLHIPSNQSQHISDLSSPGAKFCTDGYCATARTWLRLCSILLYTPDCHTEYLTILLFMINSLTL